MSWNPGLEASSFQSAGSDCTNSVIWSHIGPAVNRISRNTERNSAANENSDARPRFQPRLTSAATTGSRPNARTAASRIETSVPSETSASAIKPATATSDRIVRAGILISTGLGGIRRETTRPGAASTVTTMPAVDDAGGG